MLTGLRCAHVDERNKRAIHIIRKPMTYEVSVEDCPAGLSIDHDNVRKMDKPNDKPGGRISTLRPLFLQECND